MLERMTCGVVSVDIAFLVATSANAYEILSCIFVLLPVMKLDPTHNIPSLRISDDGAFSDIYQEACSRGGPE